MGLFEVKKALEYPSVLMKVKDLVTKLKTACKNMDSSKSYGQNSLNRQKRKISL
jgi:hypothetical protein